MNIEFELKKLLKKSIGGIPQIGAILEVEKDGETKYYKGVAIKNHIFRDIISAEQGAISSALINGEDPLTFKTIYIMTSSTSLSDLKYIRTDFLMTYLQDKSEVYLYTQYGKKAVVTVSSLKNKIIESSL